MIVYFYCLCRSRDKLKAKELEANGAEIRITKYNPEFRAEAKAYKTRLPFLIENGKVTRLYE